MAKELVRVCCVCRKSEHKGIWDNHQHHKLDFIAKAKQPTHGFCPPCLDEYTKKEFGMTYEELRNENQNRSKG